ncbi:Bug family tripartite tricarboxylate transporter substrate binding protein [Falsiroseomonas tokyonensis]|uniref:Bug family tripartite tricarboxylate transporter substrate binding protein n=1 Tax=Falsiroseomonas tokyonensis TaxID=430521 RepID=A0ABV7BR81_9PROT|nr:tripartite tricarboxylate transporter substrate-binding protein [Falsiroseomonas tokyonensis]
MQGTMHRRTILAAGLGLPALAAAHRAQAQSGAWPNRAVTVVEGYPPGGVTDLASRAVADRMAREFGVPVVVENRPGAATSVAATYVARARPDGYTLVMGTTTLAINNTLQPTLTPRDPGRELDPIGMVFRTPFILHVHESLPVRTTAELIDYAKANPGKVLFASPGTGAVSHLCLELFKARTGIDIVHVPYRGGAPAALDLRAGRVHAMFQAPQEAAPTLRDGVTRGLSVTAPTRLADYPNLPPINETISGFEVFFWQGLFAPAGTPAAVIERAGAALRAATNDAANRARLAEQGVELLSGDAETLRRTLAEDTTRWGNLIREAGIRLE